MDFRFLSRVIGKRVTITMANGQYQGTLIHVDYGQAIMLSKVKDLATNVTMSGVHLYRVPDILHVELHIAKDKEVGPKMQPEEQDISKKRIKPVPLQMVGKALEVKGRETEFYMDNMEVKTESYLDNVDVMGRVTGPNLDNMEMKRRSHLDNVEVKGREVGPNLDNIEEEKSATGSFLDNMEIRKRETEPDLDIVEVKRSEIGPFLDNMEAKRREMRSYPHNEDVKTGSVLDNVEAKRRETGSNLDNMHAVEAAVHPLEVNFTVIDQLRTKFGNAIGDIQQQPVIGLTSTGSNVCRHGSLYSLQVATKSQVYLFDIALLGSNVFKIGLKSVLEDKSVVKVIHDCRSLSDCLFHQYGILLNNVFDTQVADVFLFYMTTGGFLPQRTSSLQDCLVTYLKMDPCKISFLSKIKEIIKDNFLWSLHPMSSALHKALSLEASYVLSLHMTMANAMMEDFTSVVDGYVKVYAHHDVTSFSQVPGAKLPQQFRQLKDLQRTRKEKALKDYVMDENGFLAEPGKNLDISGKDERNKQIYKSSSSTLDKKRNKWMTEIMVVNEDKSGGPNTLDMSEEKWATGMMPIKEDKSGGSNTLCINEEKWATGMMPVSEVDSGGPNTLDMSREKWATGLMPVNEVRRHSMDHQVPPYESRILSQRFQEYHVWPAVQNSLFFQFPRPAPTPLSLHLPTTGSRIRMSASRLLAKTSYTWCS